MSSYADEIAAEPLAMLTLTGQFCRCLFEPDGTPRLGKVVELEQWRECRECGKQASAFLVPANASQPPYLVLWSPPTGVYLLMTFEAKFNEMTRLT